MLAGIWIVFRKELVYTLRDRKTLIFMLLLPTVAIPLGVYASSRILVRALQERAIKSVKIAAEPQTQEAYRHLVHEWFLATEVAQGARVLSSPVMQALIDPDKSGALGDMRPEILTDPAAFEQWTRQIVGMVRERIDRPPERRTGALIELPETLREQVLAYYQVVIQGLGLVEFVDPSTLPAVPESVEVPALPEGLRAGRHIREIIWGIKTGSIQGYLDIPAGVEGLDQDDQRVVEVTVLRDSTNDLSQEAYWRVSVVIGATCDHLVYKRLQARGLTDRFVRPLELKPGTDLATKMERKLTRIGGVLPFFVFIFTFVGGMYPAIDLGAGEKERYTLETLLLSPVGRTEITLGKSLVILGASLVAAFLSLASVALSVAYVLPQRLSQALDVHVDVATAVAAALLAVPPAVSFAGILLAVSIYARSFKEAQNYLTALMYLLIVPTLAALIPGLEMSWKLAFVPLVNVSVLARDFLKGSTHWGYYAASLGSCLVLAAICVAYAIRQFRKEEVLFRS